MPTIEKKPTFVVVMFVILMIIAERIGIALKLRAACVLQYLASLSHLIFFYLFFHIWVLRNLSGI